MSTPAGGGTGPRGDPRPRAEPEGQSGLKPKDCFPLAALPLAFATALVNARDLAGVLVLVSVALGLGTAGLAVATRRHRLRLVSWLTCAVLVATAVVVAVARVGGNGDSDAAPPTGSPSQTSGAGPTSEPDATSGAPVSGTSGGSSPAPLGTPTPTSACVRAFEPAGCDGTGAMLRLTLRPCARSTLFTTWGLRAELDVLLVDTVEHAGGCYVGPSGPAMQAVTGLDLLDAARGVVAPQLRACYLLDSNAPVPCTSRHTGELVGDWRPRDGADPGDACDQAARRYVGTTLDSQDLIATILSGPAGYRCAVTSSATLTSTVRNLRGAALPTADAG
jgi:hypothetical protein